MVRVGDGAHAEVLGALGVADFGLRVDPAQMEQRRLGLADLGGDDAVADRLARLALERVHLAASWFDHVFDARADSVRRRAAAARLRCGAACRPEMPAASSSTRRRCSGLAWMISPMRP